MAGAAQVSGVWASGMTTSGNAATDTARAAARGRAPDLVAIPVSGLNPTQVSEATKALSAAAGAAQVMVSLPLTSGLIDQVAAGQHTQDITALASALPHGTTTSPIVRVQLPPGADPSQTQRALTSLGESVKTARPGAVIAWTAPRGATPGETAVPEGIDLVVLDLPSGVAWSQLVEGQSGITAWSTQAARHGKRTAIVWTIDRATTPEMVQSLRDWVDVNAQTQRLSAETVTIADDANPDALTAYNRLWR